MTDVNSPSHAGEQDNLGAEAVVGRPESQTECTGIAPESLCARLQRKCSEWGTYWRAPDAHGVFLSHEQALEILRDALGVEVEIQAPESWTHEFEPWLRAAYSRPPQTPEAVAMLAKLDSMDRPSRKPSKLMQAVMASDLSPSDLAAWRARECADGCQLLTQDEIYDAVICCDKRGLFEMSDVYLAVQRAFAKKNGVVLS